MPHHHHVTSGSATALRLLPDSALWVSRRDDVVTGGSPWRLSRLAPEAMVVLRRLKEQGTVELRSDQELPVGRLVVERGWAHPVVDPRSGPHPLTVVIPAFGRVDSLRRCLASLDGLEILVVDDGSPEPDRIASAAADAGARLVRLSENRGPAAARNRGLLETTTELVAFVDSDCTPDPGWLDTLVPHFDDPRVSIVAPRILPRPDRPGLLPRFEEASSALDMGHHPALVRPGARLGFLPSATIVVRRDAMPHAPFDEDLKLGEDVDIVWRTADRGELVRFEPRATVRHDPPDSWSSWARRRCEYGSSAVPLEARHPGRLAPLQISPWNLAGAAAWSVGQPLVSVSLVGAAGGLLARRLAQSSIGPSVAVTMMARGVVTDLAAVGHALRREYWPLGALALLATPRSRAARLASAAIIAPLVFEWGHERPPIDPVRYLGLRLAADAAYGTGVLLSCLGARDARALAPRLRRREAQPPPT